MMNTENQGSPAPTGGTPTAITIAALAARIDRIEQAVGVQAINSDLHTHNETKLFRDIERLYKCVDDLRGEHNQDINAIFGEDCDDDLTTLRASITETNDMMERWRADLMGRIDNLVKDINDRDRRTEPDIDWHATAKRTSAAVDALATWKIGADRRIAKLEDLGEVTAVATMPDLDGAIRVAVDAAVAEVGKRLTPETTPAVQAVTDVQVQAAGAVLMREGYAVHRTTLARAIAAALAVK